MKTCCMEVRQGRRTGRKPVGESLSELGTALVKELRALGEGIVEASDQNLGHFENAAAAQVLELLRQATEQAAQQKADAKPPKCPQCGRGSIGSPTGMSEASGLALARSGFIGVVGSARSVRR